MGQDEDGVVVQEWAEAAETGAGIDEGQTEQGEEEGGEGEEENEEIGGDETKPS